MAKPLASLNELLERRQKKAAALIAEAQAKAKAAQEAPKAAEPQDHVPPKIGAKEVMAGFANASKIVLERRLQELARKYPEEIAHLLAQNARTIVSEPHKQPDPAPDFEPAAISPVAVANPDKSPAV